MRWRAARRAVPARSAWPWRRRRAPVSSSSSASRMSPASAACRGEQQLDQAGGRLFVAGSSAHAARRSRSASARLAEHRAQRAGLGPADRRHLGRIGLERRAQLAHLGQRGPRTVAAQRSAERGEPVVVAGIEPERVDVGDRERRRPRRLVVGALGHRRRGAARGGDGHEPITAARSPCGVGSGNRSLTLVATLVRAGARASPRRRGCELARHAGRQTRPTAASSRST
jgi:hypothetical protein